MTLTNHPNKLWNNGYVPYFYESGRFYFYNVPGKKKQTSYHFPAAYDFTSDLIKSQPTVDDIIQAGYFAIPTSEPEIAIISDKKHTSRLGLDDVKEILACGPEVLIVGTGASGLMKIDGALVDKLESLGIELIAKRTGGAVEEYNRIYKDKRVVFAMHLTC